MAADTLTDAGLRHLRELREVEQRDGQAIWRPVGGGEHACAQRIYETSDYLEFVFEHGAPGGYVLTPAGREALARHEAIDAANDTAARGVSRHTEAGDRRG